MAGVGRAAERFPIIGRGPAVVYGADDGRPVLSYDPAMGAFHYFLDEPVDTPRLKLRGLGYQEAMRRQLVDRPRGTGDVLVMVFYDPVWIGSRSGRRFSESGRAIVWDAGEGHYYGHAGRRWRHSWIHCDGPAVQEVIRRTALPVGEAFDLSDPRIVEQAVLGLHEELYRSGRPDPAILANTLDTMVRRLAREARPAGDAQLPPAGVLAARRYLERCHAEALSLDDLAEAGGYSVSHLSALFREHFGQSPIAMLIRHRMARAADLLADRNLSVGEVSRAVGYHDPLHFSKLFKKHCGWAPSRFRAIG